MSDKNECKSCLEPVLWCRTIPSGVAMPVNVNAEIGGTVELFTEGGPPQGGLPAGVVFTSGILYGRVIPKAEREGRTDLHFAHFATCPDGDSWRRKRNGK